MAKQVSQYIFEDALREIRKGKQPKFDQSVELHINLRADSKKQELQVRYITTLPHGTGKEKKVAVLASDKIANADMQLTEADLTKIEKGDLRPGRDFDLIVADPKLMPKLAKLARILGPAGAMPNPKTGTVSDDVAKAVEQIKKGRIEIKTEQNHPIIHTIIGKLSFEDQKLAENFHEIMTTLRHNRPPKAKPDFIGSVFVKATMGKSFELVVN